MNSIIHDDKKEARWRHGHVRMPAVQQNGDVVVPVQEDEWLFVNDDEERINQFPANKNIRVRRNARL